MPSAVRSIVWSLLTAIIVLLIGVMGLLYVSHSRDKQYESEIQNLRHKIGEKDAQIEELKDRFPQPMNLPDTIQTTSPASGS